MQRQRQRQRRKKREKKRKRKKTKSYRSSINSPTFAPQCKNSPLRTQHIRPIPLRPDSLARTSDFRIMRLLLALPPDMSPRVCNRFKRLEHAKNTRAFFSLQLHRPCFAKIIQALCRKFKKHQASLLCSFLGLGFFFPPCFFLCVFSSEKRGQEQWPSCLMNCAAARDRSINKSLLRWGPR